MIASNIFMESDADGFSSSLLYYIVDHKCSGRKFKWPDKYFVTKTGKKWMLWDRNSSLSGQMDHNSGLTWRFLKRLILSRLLNMPWLAILARNPHLHGGSIMYWESGMSLFQLVARKFVKQAPYTMRLTSIGNP